MKKINIIKTTALVISVGIIIGLMVYLLIIKFEQNGKNDYKRLGLKINESEIEYCTKYDYDMTWRYKVYKLKNYYADSMAKYKNQLESSSNWSKNKFYEYIMENFFEIIDEQKTYVDRENLYYFNKGKVYAIFDLKNAKLYYFVRSVWFKHNDYNNILEIPTDKYEQREIYSVRGGPQNDGTDYYVYKFSKEQGEKIIEKLRNNTEWSTEKLNYDVLRDLKNNEEVFSLENGIYYYEPIYRTNDLNKEQNSTKGEPTGWEIGVYDIDNHVLYYYWSSI